MGSVWLAWVILREEKTQPQRSRYLGRKIWEWPRTWGGERRYPRVRGTLRTGKEDGVGEQVDVPQKWQVGLCPLTERWGDFPGSIWTWLGLSPRPMCSVNCWERRVNHRLHVAREPAGGCVW